MTGFTCEKCGHEWVNKENTDKCCRWKFGITRDDVMVMKPSRELDALVAEKTMGWTGVKYLNLAEKHLSPVIILTGDNPNSGDCIIPDYSTDMNAAWDVYLNAMKGFFSQRKRFHNELQGLAVLDSGCVAAWPDVLTVLRSKMPESICKAALLSLSIEVPL